MDWHTLPPLSALRAFATLAEVGSFSGAGAALNVSHAAVSQQVRALEERLGVALVQRDGRRGALTPAGVRLAGALRPAFQSIRQAVDELSGADATRPLQISVTPSFATSWLMPRLSDFRHQHPGIELMILPTAELVQLAPGGIDLAVRYGRGRWPGLEADLLLPTSIVVVAASTLLDGRRITEPGELAALPWLQELGTHEVSGWLIEHGVIAPKVENIMHLPGHLVLEGLRRGDGVSVTAKALVEHDLAAGRLVVLFEDAQPDTGYFIVTRPGVLRPPLKAFVGWLKRHATPRPDHDQGVRQSPSVGVT